MYKNLSLQEKINFDFLLYQNFEQEKPKTFNLTDSTYFVNRSDFLTDAQEVIKTYINKILCV